jgi:Sel1 repeat
MYIKACTIILFGVFLVPVSGFSFDVRLSPWTTLQYCRVIRVNADTAEISYTDSSTQEEGVTTISYDLLPSEIKARYFDPYQVAQRRKQMAAENLHKESVVYEENHSVNLPQQAIEHLDPINGSVGHAIQTRRLSIEEIATDQYTTGISYLEGTGVRQNPVEGARWLLMSAKNGNVKSQSAIGYCYMAGLGVNQNLQEAKTWLQKASSLGDQVAIQNLQIIKEEERKHEKGYGRYLLILICILAGLLVRPWWK